MFNCKLNIAGGVARRRRIFFTIYALKMLEKPCFSAFVHSKSSKFFRPAAGQIRGDPYLVFTVIVVPPPYLAGRRLENFGGF